MRPANATKAANSCAANNRKCNGVCSGYRTQPECPPLIVLAILATPEKDERDARNWPKATRSVTR
jgi:hypothetical protein